MVSPTPKPSLGPIHLSLGAAPGGNCGLEAAVDRCREAPFLVILGLYWDYTGIMENRRETTIEG